MSSKNYYVNGNTVRELDTPVRHNQRTRKEIEEARRRKTVEMPQEGTARERWR